MGAGIGTETQCIQVIVIIVNNQRNLTLSVQKINNQRNLTRYCDELSPMIGFKLEVSMQQLTGI